MQQLNTLQLISIWILPLLFAITLHEVAHGWLANRLGDPTAKMLGRITLNPLRHIDPLGTVIVPLAILFFSGFSFAFGWAKPVPVSWGNLKKPKRDMALVALAGPFANILMALLWAIILKIGLMADPQESQIALYCVLTGQIGVLINLILFALNILPIPPLDGSRVVDSLLPPKASDLYARLEPFGIFIVLGLLVLGVLETLLAPIIHLAYSAIALPLGLPALL